MGKETRKQQRATRRAHNQRSSGESLPRPGRIKRSATALPVVTRSVSYPYLHPPEFRRRKRRKRDQAQQVKLQLLPVRVRECPPLEDDLIDSSSESDDEQGGWFIGR